MAQNTHTAGIEIVKQWNTQEEILSIESANEPFFPQANRIFPDYQNEYNKTCG